jgi:hypothetical protein
VKLEIEMLFSEDKLIGTILENKDEMVDCFNAIIPKCEESIRECVKSMRAFCDDAKKTGDELHKKCTGLGGEVKAFLETDVTWKAVKAELNKLRVFKDSVKKALKEQEKQAAKGATKKGEVGTPFQPEGSKLARHILEYITSFSEEERPTTCNMKWTVGVDLFATDDPKAVVIPAERTAEVASKIRAMEYYGAQKAWVVQVMKSKQMTSASAIIVKPQAMRFVARDIASLGPDVKQMSSGWGAAIDEVYAPQFYQHSVGASSFATSTDYGLIDCRMNLEGTEYIMGVPRKYCPGESIDSLYTQMTNFDAMRFIKLCMDKGFIYKSVPSNIIVLPGNHVYVMVNAEGTAVHGLRWQMPGSSKNMMQTIEYLEDLLDSYPYLKSTTSGAILEHLNKMREG